MRNSKLDHFIPDYVVDKVHCLQQKYSRLRYSLQNFSPLFKAEPVYEGRLKVILLLQVSSDDFEPTFIIFCHVTSILVCCIFAANTAVFC